MPGDLHQLGRLKFYLEDEESYMSLVNTVYFARQEAMG